MDKNMGAADRVIRLALGIVLLALTVVGPQTWWGLVGLIPLGTALVGYCPLYGAFGISTCRRTAA